MRLKIKIPASTSNLGPGFDCLGLALSLYNEFYFEKSSKWEFVGFQEKFNSLDNNLVFKAMERTFKLTNRIINPYKIQIIACIPISRGLGSSATCILAGVMAANYFLGNIYSKTDILNIATSMEGHPDNVTASFLGFCVASYIADDTVRYVQYSVFEKLQFVACIPSFGLSTHEARSVLPKNLTYQDAIFNMSRAINIPYALTKGDTDILFNLLSDKMHQNFRFPLIEDSDKFITYSKNHKIPFCISGSGSTLLFITKEAILHQLREIVTKNRWEFFILSVNTTGATMDVIQ